LALLLLSHLLTLRRPPPPTLFPYTTLFRSSPQRGEAGGDRRVRIGAGGAGQTHGGRRGVLLVVGVQDEQEVQRLRGHRVDFVLRSEEHTSELQSRENLVCRLLLEKKKRKRR